MSCFASSVSHLGFPLAGRARFRISGADCFRYLSGQITQDLSKVTDQLALPACITSAKGRLQAEVWVSAERQTSQLPAMLVDAPAELREALLLRLERYIVADDVLVEDVTGLADLFHFPGPQVPDAAEQLKLSSVRASRLGEPGWDVWVPPDRSDFFSRALSERLGRSRDYERIRIGRGIPAWGAELTEETLPPEAGLDKTHIDYHQGCYIGQEVLSRLKSVGHVNQTLWRFSGRVDADITATGQPPSALPAPGDLLYTTSARDHSVGKLTSVACDPNGEVVALGYVKRGVAARELATAQGFALTAVL
jgi:folate-binding protein YgfZ